MGDSIGDEDGGGVDGMPSGGISPSRRRAGTETSVPRILASRWRRLWKVFRIVAYWFRVFATEALSRRKGSLGGVLGDPHHRGAPPLAAPPCGVGPLAPLWSLFGALEPSVENRKYGFYFVQFREYFLCKISGTKNSRKQELALRHLVNRLVPENASKRYKV